MSEELKNLNDEVQTLVKEYRDLKDNGLKDVVHQDQFKRMTDELDVKLKEVNDAITALNAPRIEPSAEDELARVKEAVGEYFARPEGFAREGNEIKVKDVSLNVAAEGGVFLPKIFSGQMTDILRKSSPIRSLATVVKTGQNYVHPVKTDGGAGKVRTEKGAISSSSAMAFDLLNFVPFEVYDEQAATYWAHDGDAVTDLINLVLSDVLGGIGEKETEQFIKGTTNNTMAAGNVPVGLTAMTKYTTAVDRFTDETGKLGSVVTGTADAVTFDDVLALRGTLHSKYRGNARYLLGSVLETSLITLKNPETGEYIWNMADVSKANPGTLFGDPYLVCDFMPGVADDDAATLMLYGDFSKYVIADHSDIRWTIDPISDKTVIKYLGRRRTAGALTDFKAVRALLNKTDS